MIQSTPASAAARVDSDFQIAPMRLTDHRGNLVLGDHLRLAAAAVGHLDEIDAVLTLAAYLGDHLGG